MQLVQLSYFRVYDEVFIYATVAIGSTGGLVLPRWVLVDDKKLQMVMDVVETEAVTHYLRMIINNSFYISYCYNVVVITWSHSSDSLQSLLNFIQEVK